MYNEDNDMQGYENVQRDYDVFKVANWNKCKHGNERLQGRINIK